MGLATLVAFLERLRANALGEVLGEVLLGRLAGLLRHDTAILVLLEVLLYKTTAGVRCGAVEYLRAAPDSLLVMGLLVRLGMTTAFSTLHHLLAPVHNTLAHLLTLLQNTLTHLLTLLQNTSYSFSDSLKWVHILTIP